MLGNVVSKTEQKQIRPQRPEKCDKGRLAKGEFTFCAEKHYEGAVSILGERPNGSTYARAQFMATFAEVKKRADKYARRCSLQNGAESKLDPSDPKLIFQDSAKKHPCIAGVSESQRFSAIIKER